MSRPSKTLISNKTTTGAADSFQMPSKYGEVPPSKATFQAIGEVASSTGSATIVIEVSNNGVNWISLGTITLSLTTTASSDGFASDAPWCFYRGNVTAISGTGATVSLIMGIA